MNTDIEKRPQRYELGPDDGVHVHDGEDYAPPIIVANKLSRKLSARQVQ